MPEEPENQWWEAPVAVLTLVASGCLAFLMLAITWAVIEWLVF